MNRLERDPDLIHVSDDIARYFDEITEVDRGTFGTVYRAKANDLGMQLLSPGVPFLANGRLFALKKVVVDDPSKMAVLKDEVLNMRQCDLRQSVRYHGCFINDSTLHAWVAMTFIDAPNLKVLIERGKLSRRQKNHVAKQLAYALLECHSKGLVHRDIKPANIMISNLTASTADVRLVDFGLSCSISKCPLSPLCANTRGSVGYIDVHDETDRGIANLHLTSLKQSDWWSYGQTLVYMYTNRELFVDDEAIDRWKGAYGTLSKSDLDKIPNRLHEMLSRLTDPSMHPNDRPTSDEILRSVTSRAKHPLFDW